MSDRLALLERAQQGDDRAEAQLLTENAGLIWSIVRRYNGCGVETDDLYQLGCIGFVKAVKGFDLTYGTQFSTYAVPKIAGEIRRFLRDDGPVKVGRTMREKGQTLWAARERLQGRLGCEPKLSQLAAETGMTPEEIAAVDLALIAPDSLQQETAEGLDAGVHTMCRGAQRLSGGAYRSAGRHRRTAGERTEDHSPAFFQGVDAGADRPHLTGIAGPGLAAGAPQPAKAAGPAGRGVTSGRDGVKRGASRQQRDFECKMDQDRGGSIAERSSRYRRDGRSLVTER